MNVLKSLKKAAAAALGTDLPQEVPAKRWQPPPRRGALRFSLLILAAVVVLINLPFISRQYMPGHDSKAVLGVFDYMYSNWLFAGQLPQWMVYGLHGLDAAAFQISNLSAASYLTIFAGKFFGIKDSLSLFSVNVCLEQLFFLLGFYLLSRRLFREPLTVFCICLTAAGSITWQAQLFFNLRLFCLLPLTFYFILRVRDERAGYCGWLAGILAILGPAGFTYAYIFWALILVVFSLGVFWGSFRSLRVLFQMRFLNGLLALVFVSLMLAFLGTLWHALDNFTFDSPGRDASGKVALSTFLTYGGNNLADMLSALLLPSKYMEDTGGHAGMADYIGLICIFCLPWALGSLRNSPQAYPFAMTFALLATFSLGGLFACVVYFVPGMQMFRHIGFLTGVIKLLILILSGFGFDALIDSLRERTLIRRPTPLKLLLICLGLIVYVDLNIGGANWSAVCRTLEREPKHLVAMLEEASIYTLARALLMFLFAIAAWKLCRSATSSTVLKPDFAITLLVIGIVGDCLLFQSELYSYLHRGKKPFDFPAMKLAWPIIREQQIPTNDFPRQLTWTNGPGAKLLCDISRFEQIPAGTLSKYQAWTNAPDAEYQAALSCALQWDPPAPLFRADWVAKNVVEMQNVLTKVSPQEVAIVSGFAGLKFRLVGDSSAVYVKTDQEALKLLGSKAGWSRQVIITDSTNKTSAPDSPVASNASRLDLIEFSANSFSLSLSNGLAQPAWLIYADAYAPGWHATVNEKPVPILKAYAAFKAIKVQPGNSQVRFYYHDGIHSTSLSLFAAMAGCAAAFGLLWLIWLILKEPFER